MLDPVTSDASKLCCSCAWARRVNCAEDGQATAWGETGQLLLSWGGSQVGVVPSGPVKPRWSCRPRPD